MDGNERVFIDLPLCRSVIKETLWVISNLTACSPQQLAAIFQDPSVLLKLMEILKGQSFDVRKEAARCILNVTAHGGPFLESVLSLGALPEFVHYLRGTDDEARALALQFMELLMRLKEDGARIVADSGGLDILRSQSLSNDENSQKISFLLATYFSPR